MSQPARRPLSPETIALKLLVLALAAVLWSHGLTTAAVVLGVLAVLSYWRVRQVIRYSLAVAGMALSSAPGWCTAPSPTPTSSASQAP